MDISLLAKGGLGIGIGLSELSQMISEQSPEILDERKIDLKVFSADFTVRRVSDVGLVEKDYNSLTVTIDIEISAYKSLLITDFKLDGALRLYLSLDFTSTEHWFNISFNRYEWISPIVMEPLNLSGIVTNKAEERIDEMIPVILDNLNQKINRDINLKIVEQINNLDSQLYTSDVGKHIHIECNSIDRRVINGKLLLTMDGIYVETTDEIKSHLNSTQFRNSTNGLDDKTPFQFLIEIGESVLKDQIETIEVPSHEFQLDHIAHSKGFLCLKFRNTRGIIGDFTIWLSILIQEGAIAVLPQRIQFDKKLVKFIGNINWSQDLLLDIIEKKIRVIMESNIDKAIEEMPIQVAKVFNQIIIDDLKVHSTEGVVEGLVKISIKPIFPISLDSQ